MMIESVRDNFKNKINLSITGLLKIENILSIWNFWEIVRRLSRVT